VIALSDQSMALLLSRATAISPDRLPRWLEAIAAKFEKAHRAKFSRSAIYTRRYRERLRAGKMWLPIVVDEVPLVATLVDQGLLNPLQADHRAALAAATERVLKQLCEGSHRDDATYDRVRVGLVLSAFQKRRPP
jgi:hypothetical protein